jgi:hypothetical protein
MYLILSIYCHKNFKKMSHNVPAVYDVFAVAIKECEAFQQPQKCGGEKPHKGRKADWGFFVARGRYCARSIYRPVMCRNFSTRLPWMANGYWATIFLFYLFFILK